MVSNLKVPDQWKKELREGGQGFHTLLFALIYRAEKDDLERLRAGYPEEVAVVEATKKAGNVPDEVEVVMPDETPTAPPPPPPAASTS